MSAARRVLFFDGSAGASGDMILGALVDLGVPLAVLRRALATLPLEGWTLRSRRVERAGLRARKVDVGTKDSSRGRRFVDIRRIIRGGSLEPAERDLALTVFQRLFEAEAEVHGAPADEIHLHEAGAVDAIVDVVGASIALDRLAPDRIVVSPLTTGFGRVRCTHGVYPVPAPATLALCRGIPIRAGEVEAERLTPTGAAILTTVADAWEELPVLRPERIGLGAGSRELAPHANVLRAVLGEGEGMETPSRGPTVAVLELAVDETTPQALAYTVERLLERGALDAYTQAATMKKGRSGHRLTVLCRPDDVPALSDLLLRETSSLGLRVRTERRVELPRRTERVSTRYGSVRVKFGKHAGGEKAWPEYEDCAKLARNADVPLRDVQRAALDATMRGKRRKR